MFSVCFVLCCSCLWSFAFCEKVGVPRALGVTMYRSRTTRAILLYSVLGRDSVRGACAIFASTSSFLTSCRCKGCSLLLVSVCVGSSVANVRTISVVHRASTSVPITFVAADARRTLRDCELSTVNCVRGPISTTRLDGVLRLTVLGGSSTPSLCIGEGGDVRELTLSSVVCVRRETERVFVRLGRGKRVDYCRGLSSLSSRLPTRLFFLPRGDCTMGLSCIAHVSASLGYFIVTSSAGVPVGERLSNGTGGTLRECCFSRAEKLGWNAFLLV